MRTLLQVQTELSIAYAARVEILQGKRITQAFFSSVESSTKYFFEGMKLPDVEHTIFLLREEEQGLLNVQQGQQRIFRTGETVPLIVTKQGTSTHRTGGY